MEAEQDKTWSQLAAHFKRFFGRLHQDRVVLQQNDVETC